VCADYLGQSATPCYSYSACTDDPREFEINNAYAFNTSEYDTILYPQNGTGAGSQVLYLRNTETGQQKCFSLMGSTTKSRIPTVNVEYIEDYTNCTDCELACDAQDIIIYFDEYTYCNSCLVNEESRFNAMKDGLLEYLSSIEDDINNGTIRVGLYRKLTVCNGDSGQVLALSENYGQIVSEVNGMSYSDVHLLNSLSVYQDIYDELTGNNSRPGATGTVVVLTDTMYDGIAGNSCWTPASNVWWAYLVKVNFLNNMKLGWVNGIGGKQIRVQIVEGISDYLASYWATESVASTPSDYIETTWSDWSGSTGSWSQLSGITCNEFESPGDGFNTYYASP
jgi:hypothetical protein